MMNWINKKRNKKGFTLVELVVVIAILGILAAIAVPRLSGTRDNANKKAHLANISTIESAITIYQADNETSNYPTIEDLTKDEKYLKSTPFYPGSTTVQYYIDASSKKIGWK